MTASDEGWTEWHGGECPIDGYIKVDVKFRSGGDDGGYSAHFYSWDHDGAVDDIIAYRLHQPEPQYCESVTRTIPDQPTIESLAADYRAKLAIYEQAQEELNSHRCGVEAALSRLQLAGWSIGLSISPQADGSKSEPENEPLNITDWRDLRVGDVVNAEYYGEPIIGRIVELEAHDYIASRPFMVMDDNGHTNWVTSTEFKFIRRP